MYDLDNSTLECINEDMHTYNISWFRIVTIILLSFLNRA